MKPQKRGLPENRIVPERKMYFRPEVTHCPDCGTKLKRHHNASNKIVATLEGIIEVWNMAYHCPDLACGKPKRYFRSVQADALCLKHTSYAYDVLALVGEMRFKQHMTVTEISEALTERGIPTSERHAMRLYEWYLTLLRASLTADVKEQLVDVVKEYNGLLLSMDGVQPEKGNETLYVVREGFSGRILAAKNLKSGSKTELMALLKPVKDLGFPVIGLVSDGQQSIRLAMGETWPDTPYQYCQYHYLKDIAKPVVDLDRKLKTGLKKSLRGLREIEKQVEDDDSIESEVTRDYLAATRSLLLEDGNPPLDLPGIQIYEKAKAVKASLEKSVAKKGGPYS
ncbi:transposase [Paenibacillus camerounensis]|uniref:transposase n=1 Tax=Paenibacillus camerounensis TaxID=1243663 RepID=UPI000A328B74|nr:transposase [Paenibacillus camerounensis]